MGRDLSREKITASHLEEEKNIEFGILVVISFFSPKKRPRQISRVRQTLLTDLAVAEAYQPFRKRSLPFLTVDAIIGNQAFSHGRSNICSATNTFLHSL